MCKLLALTGKSGCPDSHFHSPAIADWMRYYDLIPDNSKTERDVLTDIFQAARNRGIGNTGVFGLRMQGHSVDFFLEKLQVLVPGEIRDAERIETIFGKTLFIHLSRKNKIEQAVSYVKASQSGLWHRASNGEELERVSTHKEPTYDAKSIQTQYEAMIAMDEHWNTWFADEELNPMRINYEDLSADPVLTTGDVLEQLGLNRKLATELTIPVSKLADNVSQQWVERFCLEKGL